jgi:hypothetical protein
VSFIMALCLGVGCTRSQDSGDTDTDAVQLAPTRIYGTLVSHNETMGNEPCDRVLEAGADQEERYLANREATVAAADIVVAAEAAWDWQSDWLYLERVVEYDKGNVLESTDGKNLVQYLAEQPPNHIIVDPHSHEKAGYNYSDVAALLVGLGAPDTGIVGGFVANPPEEEDWTRFREGPIVALQSEYEFSGTVLWGAGSKRHSDDPLASGIWRPKDAEHFLEDDPSQSLLSIGSYNMGPETIVGVMTLLEKLRNGELEENRLYTVGIMVRQCNLDLAGQLDVIQGIVDDLAPEVETGDFVWATLPDIIEIWEQQYQSEPVILEYEK